MTLFVALLALLLIVFPFPASASPQPLPVTHHIFADDGGRDPVPAGVIPGLRSLAESVSRIRTQNLFQVFTARWLPALTQEQETCPATILIDVHRRKLLLFSDTRLKGSYPVCVGKPKTPTPVGNWQISRKALDWGDGFGTRWIGLNVPWGIYGIHGTNKPWSIGRYESGGCIRMFNWDVEAVYPQVRPGTPVIIVGDILRGRTIRQGDNGCDVIEVQRVLNRLGFYEGSIDGRFQAKTIAAVREFRKAHGLPLLDDAVDDDVYRLLGL